MTMTMRKETGKKVTMREERGKMAMMRGNRKDSNDTEERGQMVM